jgi:hypothetical protein
MKKKSVTSKSIKAQNQSQIPEIETPDAAGKVPSQEKGIKSSKVPTTRVLRIVIEKPFLLTKKEIDKDQYFSGKMSSIPWESVFPIVDGISQIVTSILNIRTEQLESFEAVPNTMPTSTPEMHLIVPSAIEDHQKIKITLGIRSYFSYLKDLDGDLISDFDSDIDEAIVQKSKEIAESTISEIGGCALAAPLSVVGGLVMGKLGLSGRLAREEMEEEDGEPFEIEGEWDGFHGSKHIAFLLTQLPDKKDKNSVEIHYEDRWQNTICKQKHSQKCKTVLEVKIRTKGKRKWYVLTKIKMEDKANPLPPSTTT